MYQLQLKAEKSGRVEGYASVFGVLDGHGDIVTPGAYKQTIEDYQSKGYQPPLLWQHDQETPIGAIHVLKEDTVGLWLEGELAMGVQKAREAHELLQMGSIGGLSIGYRVPPGGAKSKDGVRYLNQINLSEISVVTSPANQEARVTGVKHIGTKTELEALLRKAGLSRAAAKAVCARGYEGLEHCDDAEALDELAASFEKLNQLLRG